MICKNKNNNYKKKIFVYMFLIINLNNIKNIILTIKNNTQLLVMNVVLTRILVRGGENNYNSGDHGVDGDET